MKQSTLVVIAAISLAAIALVLFIILSSLDTQSESEQTMTEENQTATTTANTPEVPFITIAPNVSLAPIAHASAVLEWGEQLIYVDPVGDASQYRAYGDPDLIFITHRHSDHFDAENLSGMMTENTTLVTNQDVADQLPDGLLGTVQVVAPEETATFGPLTLDTIPAYNLREEAQQYHPRERGDLGLVFSDGTSRIYFSGDSEDTPEMRALEDIDVAFVAMNLPYTMEVDAAAEGVLAFAPATIYPYHFRTPEGFSDTDRFKTLIEEGNPDINVMMLDWYAEEDEENEN